MNVYGVARLVRAQDSEAQDSEAQDSPDGDSASEDGTLFTCSSHQKEVFSLCFSPDGKHIATGSRDKTVRIFDATNGLHLSSPVHGSRFCGALSYDDYRPFRI